MEFAHHIITSFSDYILPFLVVLGVLIFVHEFGHYQVARWCGVRIEAFSIGFGPAIWTKKSKKTGTKWRLAIVPLGGYVQMLGDADPASAKNDPKAIKPKDRPFAFCFKPLYQRALIVVAGPAINLLFAIFALAILFSTQGQPYSAPLLQSIQADSAAQKAGLKAGDRVMQINGLPLKRFEALQRVVQAKAGELLTLTVERAGKSQEIQVTPDTKSIKDRFGNDHQIGYLGVQGGKPEYIKRSPWMAVYYAGGETWEISISTLKAFKEMILGMRSAKDLGGPLRIAQMSSDIKKEGLASFAWFMAVLSINLALINLLPIPVLDGGHLMFYALEAIFRRPVPEKVQEYMIKIGFGAVMALVVFSTWNDINNLKIFSALKQLVM